MNDRGWLRELIRKIELQSIIVFVITLIAGIYLFTFKGTFPSPTAILGIVLIGFGALFSIISFFTNNIRESYHEIINEYKTLSAEVTKNYKKISESYQMRIGFGNSDSTETIKQVKEKYRRLTGQTETTTG